MVPLGQEEMVQSQQEWEEMNQRVEVEAGERAKIEAELALLQGKVMHGGEHIKDRVVRQQRQLEAAEREIAEQQEREVQLRQEAQHGAPHRLHVLTRRFPAARSDTSVSVTSAKRPPTKSSAYIVDAVATALLRGFTTRIRSTKAAAMLYATFIRVGECFNLRSRG